MPSGRYPFGGDQAGFVFALGDDNQAILQGGETITLWTLRTGGTQYTDLSTDLAGAFPISTVTVDDGTGAYGRGSVPVYYGPAGIVAMWASANGGPRKLVTTTSIEALVADMLDEAAPGLAAGSSPVYSVKAYGALGDGSTDDTVAINAAIAAAPAGAVVWFPAGVYLVSKAGDPNGLMLKAPRQNVTLEGPGARGTIIKVKNSVGDYTAVISDGTLAGTTNMSGFTMRGLQIDQNAAGNPIADPQANPGLFFGGAAQRPRVAVRIYVGTDVLIENCTFINSDSVNTILGNGGASVIKRWTIRNCLFSNVGNGAVHDHSSIYLHGETLTVDSCKFYGGGGAAIAAVELHGSNQTVTNCDADRYMVFANLTGVANVTKGVVCTGNTGTRMGSGLQLWTFNNTGTGGVSPGLESVLVTGNQFEVEYDYWNVLIPVAYRYGIALNTTSTGVARVVRIADNQITYLPRTRSVSSTDNQSAGILWYRVSSPTAGFADEDIEICDNVIRGAISAGIYVQPKFKTRRLKIVGNKIIDPGQGCPNTAYRVGVFLATEGYGLEDAEVGRNDTTDTSMTAHVAGCGIDTQFTDLVVNGRMYSNTMRCQDRTNLPVHKGDPNANAAWLIRAEQPVFTIPVGVWVAGSTMLATDSGQLYTQATAPAGAAWIAGSSGVPSASIGLRAGKYYRSEGVGANVTPTKNTLYYTPFVCGEARLFDRFGITVVTGAAGTTARIGIWASDLHGVPTGTPIVVGLIDTATAGSKELVIAQTLSPGQYWFGCVTQGGTTQPTLNGLSAAGGQSTGVAAGDTLASATANTPRSCYTQTGVSGVLGAAADNGSASLAPSIAIRVIGAGPTTPDTPVTPNPPATPSVYRTSSRYLFDPAGSKVIVRGPEQNFGRIDWLHNEFVTEIGKTASNTVRIIPFYQIDPPWGGTRSTIEDIEDQIRRGINAHMLVDFALDGGKLISSWVRPEIVALVLKYERYLVLHLKGESYEDSDSEWRDVAINEIGQIRAKGIKCPLYVLAREGGRRLPCLLGTEARDIVAADPLHNIVFGWQAYWGMIPPTSLDYIATGWQDNFGMSLRQAFQYCRDAAVPIQVGMIKHSDHQDESLSTNEVPYSAMMDLAKLYELGWLWWDWRMGIDDLTTDGYYPNWDGPLGAEIMVTAPSSVANSSVRTAWMLAQVAP